jgi:hypothetical protein
MDGRVATGPKLVGAGANIANPLPFDLAPWGGEPTPRTERALSVAVWGFIAFAVLLRFVRFAMNFPLWGDEAFVAVNFLDRGYLELLRPLDYGQICPVLFLWVECTAVKLLGFNEPALRGYSLICGLASIFLFHHLARRFVRGYVLMLAVGIFAVSVHPIRHATEAKPYASDLLVALVILTIAMECWRTPERTNRLWLLAAFTPIGLGLSHPAVFVLGAVAAGMALPAWHSRGWAFRLPFAVFVLALGGSFLAIHLCFAGAHSNGPLLKGLQAYWANSFPPLKSPSRLAVWFVSVNTGTMFAYPWGGARGASVLTTILFLVGMSVLWRRGWRVPLVYLLGPFLLVLVAAAFKRYPYGGEARQMQFVAPAICLLAAIGAARVVQAIRVERARLAMVPLSVMTLVLGGLELGRRDVLYPYRMQYDAQARDFARRFWPEISADAEVFCLRRDFRIVQRGQLNLRTATYLCNQAIYSPQRRAGGPNWQKITRQHPMRSVLYHDTHPDNPAVQDWLKQMKLTYELKKTERIAIDVSAALAGPRSERIIVYEFVPRSDALLSEQVTTSGRSPSRVAR